MERVAASLGVKYGKQRHQEECHAQGVLNVSLGSPLDQLKSMGAKNRWFNHPEMGIVIAIRISKKPLDATIFWDPIHA